MHGCMMHLQLQATSCLESMHYGAHVDVSTYRVLAENFLIYFILF